MLYPFTDIAAAAAVVVISYM